jgi:RNA polymerase sigma-70 factor, ECF subfamily
MGLDQDTALRLLLQERSMLMGYILSIVRDAHQAEDVFQNVSLLVLKKCESVDSDLAFPAWLRKTARFEALNALRKEGRGPEPLDEAVLESLEAHWRAQDSSNRSSVGALRSCIQKLAPRARLLVDLRYGENVSGQRLAEKLAQPLNTVYVALSRLHRSLAECVRRQLAGEGTSLG